MQINFNLLYLPISDKTWEKNRIKIKSVCIVIEYKNKSRRGKYEGGFLDYS